MGFQSVLPAILILLAFAVVIYGAFSSRKSLGIAVCTFLVAALAVGVGWYAWEESESLPWTVVYGLIAVAAAAVGVRQLVGGYSRGRK